MGAMEDISVNESIWGSNHVKDILSAYTEEQHWKHGIVLDCAVRVSYQTESQCRPEQLTTTSDALLTIKSSSLISGLTVFVFTLAFFGRAYFRNDFLYNLQFKFTAYGWFEQKPNLKKQYFLDSFTWFACIIVNRTVLYASSFLARVKFRHCYHYLNYNLARKRKNNTVTASYQGNPGFDDTAVNSLELRILISNIPSHLYQFVMNRYTHIVVPV